MLLFQFHAGNGSSICQRLTPQRGKTDRTRKRGKGGEGRQEKHKSDLGKVKEKRQTHQRDRKNESGEVIINSKDGNAGPLPALDATLIMRVCIWRN